MSSQNSTHSTAGVHLQPVHKLVYYYAQICHCCRRTFYIMNDVTASSNNTAHFAFLYGMISLPLEQALLLWFRTIVSRLRSHLLIELAKKNFTLGSVCIMSMFEFSLPTVGSYCYWFGQWWPVDHNSKKSRWSVTTYSLNQWWNSFFGFFFLGYDLAGFSVFEADCSVGHQR